MKKTLIWILWTISAAAIIALFLPNIDNSNINNLEVFMQNTYSMPHIIQTTVENRISEVKDGKYSGMKYYIYSWEVYIETIVTDRIKQHFMNHFQANTWDMQFKVTDSKVFYDVKLCIETGITCENIK